MLVLLDKVKLSFDFFNGKRVKGPYQTCNQKEEKRQNLGISIM
jgi:hypothetical protein